MRAFSSILRLLLPLTLISVLMITASAADGLPTEADFASDPYCENFPIEYYLDEDSGAAAETTDATGFVITSAGSGTAGTTVKSSNISGTYWLIMPASANPEALPLQYNLYSSMTISGSKGSATVASGSKVNLVSLCGRASETGSYSVTMTSGSNKYSVKIRFSANVSALYLTSADASKYGRSWVEKSKSNKATGSMVLQNPDEAVVFSGELTQIKGRGNTTWNGRKKPYQIKLKDKADLLESGEKANKNKTWVLLANYYDGTLLHNAITDDLAKAMGMDSSIEYRFVDLYYDGEYRGSYLLCEKVAVNSGRVEINDLEGDNEDANPNVSYFSTLGRGSGKTSNGATYYYTKNMTNPSDITGGYLLEMDYSTRATEEASYFITSHGNYVVVKSPEFCSKEEMNYIASYYQEFEDAAYSGGTNTKTGKRLADYMDLESAAQCYLINEFSKNPDSFLSSAYVYKDAGSDVMYMGPVWDYDISYGYGNFSNYSKTVGATGWYTGTYRIAQKLLTCKAFCSEVERVYAEQLSPLVNQVLLGSSSAVSSDGALHSLKWYEAQTAASAACNYTLWSVTAYTGNYPAGKTYDSNISYFNKWISNRATWLNNNLPAKYAHAAGWANEDGAWYYYASNYRQRGWQKIGGSWYYLGDDGKMCAGWQCVDDCWYYLNENGVMQTGWVKSGDRWYYLSSSGAMKTGWVHVDDAWYYMNASGVMQTGWQKVDGSWYYLSSSGVMKTGWLKDSGSWYYLSSSGVMKTGWLRVNGSWYYLSSSGVMKTGWQKVDGSWYYLSSSGVMKTGWLKIDGNWYYLSSSGVMKTGWQEIGGSRYYFNTVGEMQTGLVNIEGSIYYFDENGEMQTGVVTIGEVCYCFDESGVMQTGFVADETGSRYFGEDGVMATGWLELEDGTYYLNPETGYMTVGTVEIDDTTYTFGEDGRLIDDEA